MGETTTWGVEAYATNVGSIYVAAFPVNEPDAPAVEGAAAIAALLNALQARAAALDDALTALASAIEVVVVYGHHRWKCPLALQGVVSASVACTCQLNQKIVSLNRDAQALASISTRLAGTGGEQDAG